MILGIDEVGRGPWAGPLVVGAVVLGDAAISGLADSKKLTAARRAALAVEIHQSAAGVGLGWVHAEEIDSIGLSAALRLATRRAVERVKAPYHEIIIDGTINLLAGTTKESYVSVLPKADALIESVSAASIVAKVARDDWMVEQAALYPEYGFDSHVGYGTAKHRTALDVYGVTPLHRRSFAPIAALVSERAVLEKLGVTSTTEKGNHYESLVATWLEGMGHALIDRNWRTKWCEIDIVSRYGGDVYFTEVRFRSTESQGGAIGSINSKKLRQMTFAAEAYLAVHKNENHARIQVAAVDNRGDVELFQVE